MRVWILFAFLVALWGGEHNKSLPMKVEYVNLDPVYMLDVRRYPKFQAKIELSNGQTVLFCCPKAMFDFYLRPFNYPEYHVKAEKDFKKLWVKDYLSGQWIDAKKAIPKKTAHKEKSNAL